MGWKGDPYETFQRLVRKAEAGLESRMVMILTGQAEVRPELALAILERKFPQRWAKVTVVAAPPHHLNFNVADILQKVQERTAQGQLPPATTINASVKARQAARSTSAAADGREPGRGHRVQADIRPWAPGAHGSPAEAAEPRLKIRLGPP
jgi:hypothetical protein